MKSHPIERHLQVAVVGLALAAGLLPACDDEKKSATPDAGVAVASSAPAQPPPPATPRMPEVTLTERSVQVGIDELQLQIPSFDTAFREMLKKYPVDTPDLVVFNVDRKVPTPLATKLTYVLFDAGAKSIEVRTRPRGSFPDRLRLTSDKQVGKVLPCTFAGTITENLGVAFWPIQGGTAKRYTKGMAGPDLSAMHEVFQKEEAGCGSTVFFFSADDTVEWGHAYDLATSVIAHEPKYKIDKVVLLRSAPAAGKPVKVGG
jgi:hypothetical protein